MYVKVDERIANLQESLPGVNCGACGYPGCAGYAAALLSGECKKTNLCTPGGPDVVLKISAILGVTAEALEQKAAVVHCNGDFNAQQKKMNYFGIQSCAAAKQLFGGESSCAFGCLSYGDCQIACPSNAICMTSGLARVTPGLCTGCSLCVKACPNNLIIMMDSRVPIIIACKNIEKGAVTRKKCSSGCIACGKCVRECPQTAITLENNLAVINYDKCNGCGNCIKTCATRCITSPLIRI